MNIDDLTYGQLKEIAGRFGKTKTTEKSSRVAGSLESVIVRCRDAGVHYGQLESYEGRTVWLRNSRRLWKWTANDGIALSGVAIHGIKNSESKIDTVVPSIVLMDACEIIPMSESAAFTIINAK